MRAAAGAAQRAAEEAEEAPVQTQRAHEKLLVFTGSNTTSSCKAQPKRVTNKLRSTVASAVFAACLGQEVYGWG